MKNGSIEMFFGIIAGAIIIALIIGIFSWDYKTTYGNQQTLRITVKDKYIKRSGSDTDKYLVVDSAGNTYQITDLMFLGKYNSTDLYNELDIGDTYEIITTGIRSGFWSLYPNINKIIREEN